MHHPFWFLFVEIRNKPSLCQFHKSNFKIFETTPWISYYKFTFDATTKVGLFIVFWFNVQSIIILITFIADTLKEKWIQKTIDLVLLQVVIYLQIREYHPSRTSHNLWWSFQLPLSIHTRICIWIVQWLWQLLQRFINFVHLIIIKYYHDFTSDSADDARLSNTNKNTCTHNEQKRFEITTICIADTHRKHHKLTNYTPRPKICIF